jgi:hypothetical protein
LVEVLEAEDKALAKLGQRNHAPARTENDTAETVDGTELPSPVSHG